MKKISIFAGIFLISTLLSFTNCLAESQEENKGFSISPFFQDITLEKNQNGASFDVKITNNTQNLAIFKLSLVDFGAMDESGGVAFLAPSDELENKYGLASWVILEKDAIVLEPGETQVARVKIENKESLSPGGHYAAIIAKMDNSQSGSLDESSEISLEPSLASLIFVRKIGGEIYNLILKNSEFQGGIFSLASNIKIRFQNSGNVHLIPRGTVRIIDPLGREVMKGIINNESALILPETFRVFPVPLRKIALAFVPGKYEVLIEYRYDRKDDFVIWSENLDFFPISAMLACLIITGSIAGYGWLKFRKKRRETGRKDKKTSEKSI